MELSTAIADYLQLISDLFRQRDWVAFFPDVVASRDNPSIVIENIEVTYTYHGLGESVIVSDDDVLEFIVCP